MGANNTRLTPRQKMINLMYIVLTAMLALNVSSDVLDGFTQVEDGLSRPTLTLRTAMPPSCANSRILPARTLKKDGNGPTRPQKCGRSQPCFITRLTL